MLQFESDAKVSKMLLNKNMRQLNYLQNLTKTNDSDEASNCPICAGPLQQAEGVNIILLLLVVLFITVGCATLWTLLLFGMCLHSITASCSF